MSGTHYKKWDSTILTNVLKFKIFINPLFEQFVYFMSNSKVMVQKFFIYISKCVGLTFPCLFLTNVTWRYLAVEIKILKKENLRVQGRSLETEVIPLVDKLK